MAVVGHSLHALVLRSRSCTFSRLDPGMCSFSTESLANMGLKDSRVVRGGLKNTSLDLSQCRYLASFIRASMSKPTHTFCKAPCHGNPKLDWTGRKSRGHHVHISQFVLDTLPVRLYSGSQRKQLGYKIYCSKLASLSSDEKQNPEPELVEKRTFRRTPVSYLELSSCEEAASTDGSENAPTSRESITVSSRIQAEDDNLWTRKPSSKSALYAQDITAASSNLDPIWASNSHQSDISAPSEAPMTEPWFPIPANFQASTGREVSSTEVIGMLEPYLVDTRKERLQKAVKTRTVGVIPVIEGIIDLGNVSAVCRTAEALGFQSVNIVSPSDKRRYKHNPRITMGTDKWLSVETWEDCTECFDALKSRGYRIAVTHISPHTIPIYDMDWTIPTAIVFGNEKQGVSEAGLNAADIHCSIPMCGMVDSFNISVAAAIVLHHATRDRIARQGRHGDLSPEHQERLLAEFYMRSTRYSENIIEQLLQQDGAKLGRAKKNKMREFLTKVQQCEEERGGARGEAQADLSSCL
eukprot:jgi/Mesen1/7052/ME000369S06376